MSIEIRAKVQRLPKTGGTPLGEPWLAVVYTNDPEPTEEHYHDSYETTWCGSLPEAIQAVLLMRNRLERQLMDEVHASHASRRARRCECPIGMHSINCHEHERNKYTTEATA
ncbi:MAG: hypothetical protein LCH36_00285 [Actinobacteria bacterium]|nr:hypothetical protein [Actinomycetota bacterium]